jgi:hypothetical protein
MDSSIKLIVDTTFDNKGIWKDVNDEIRGKIKDVLPLCLETGKRHYIKIKGYENLPWKVKHHLDIRIEMYNDNKHIK